VRLCNPKKKNEEEKGIDAEEKTDSKTGKPERVKEGNAAAASSRVAS